LNPHGTRYRQILSLLRMPISPLRRGRVLNLTPCRSKRQQHRRRRVCTDTQQTLTFKSLPISTTSKCRSNPCDAHGLPCGDCSASTPGLFPWVMFWVLIDSNWFRFIGPHTRLVRSSSFTRTFTVPFFRYKEFNLEIGMSRKRKPLPPRHKRLTRQGRLQAAKTWLRSYPGKTIALGYRKHFGVDSLCAIRELRRLGVAIDPAYERAVLAASHTRNKKRRREEEFAVSEESYYGFAFIAGYTVGGAPYGITVNEAECLTTVDFPYVDATPSGSDDDIPF
jgi:hypothetical protein